MSPRSSTPTRSLDRAIEAAEQIAAWTPWGIRLTKQGMWAALEIPSERAAIEYEDRQQIMALHGTAPAEAVDRVPGEAARGVRGLMSWSDEAEGIIDGDLTAGLAYVTPAGGVVVTAVAPIGLHDRAAGTVGFTTSLGFGKKLERIKRNPKVALAYHAREHGFADSDLYVLVQGIARPTTNPDRDYLENVIAKKAERFMGPPKRGVFWDRWLEAYYADRVPVTVDVERVLTWPGDELVERAALAVASQERDRPARQAAGHGPAAQAARLDGGERLPRGRAG